ncbi:MAG: DNA cytosine methyltransferase [Clostridia bacterium]|nr:DNA cytosine methyltransferase [Clostridia bacterium]
MLAKEGDVLNNFKYIDLFAGIGGFHQAMGNLGGKCVFASEIDKYCLNTYEKNYGINADNNIRSVEAKDIPPHDVLCAGFPCQSFSKAGYQKGMSDARGNLFFEIERILEYHHTKYIILENVRNLVSHDKGNTWKTIHSHLKSLGYRLTPVPIIVSPHQFGVPQLRERVVIMGIYDPKNVNSDLEITFENPLGKNDNSIYTILEKNKVEKKYYISEKEEFVLSAWDEFYKGIKESVIGYPIWAEYFVDKDEDENFPKWKKEFVRKNKILYWTNKDFIDKWLKKYNYLKDFTPTQRKMEWQAGNNISSLWEGVIQFRPSGIRVKTPTTFPALVAIVQVPIIGKYKRRLTIQEAARLQSFPSNFIPNSDDHQAYKQFGNAVNVKVIEESAKKLFEL